MGLESPRVCAQVCSSPKPVDANAVKDFQAAVKNCGADQGLLIAWRGFQGAAVAESEGRFFDVRLWNDEDVIEAVMAVYDRLPTAIQTSLALRRIWVPIPEEE
jgi:restriction system protein